MSDFLGLKPQALCLRRFAAKTTAKPRCSCQNILQGVALQGKSPITTVEVAHWPTLIHDSRPVPTISKFALLSANHENHE